jgi:hypothetical protein
MANRTLRRLCGIGALLLVAPSAGPVGAPGPLVGLDHIPVAVRDLDQACATFRALGFAIKPGRPHPNGIRNAHVKYPDGSGIELITAGAAVDGLTTRYVQLIAQGDGPAFLALRARDTDRLVAALRSRGFPFSRAGDLTELRQPGLEWLFVVRDNRSPTDRPEHFDHRNGATALRSVWVATDAGAELERFLVHLGGVRTRRLLSVPDPVTVPLVTVDGGEVAILPASRQLAAGRPIVGVSLRVDRVDVVGRQLSEAGFTPRVHTGAARRVVVAPSETHGIWLEFR